MEPKFKVGDKVFLRHQKNPHVVVSVAWLKSRNGYFFTTRSYHYGVFLFQTHGDELTLIETEFEKIIYGVNV